MNFILGSGWWSLSEVKLEFIQRVCLCVRGGLRRAFVLFLETRIPGLRFAFFGIQGLTERHGTAGFEILFCTHTPYRHQSMSTSVLIRSPGHPITWSGTPLSYDR
jgi:hypothetical protein